MYLNDTYNQTDEIDQVLTGLALKSAVSKMSEMAPPRPSSSFFKSAEVITVLSSVHRKRTEHGVSQVIYITYWMLLTIYAPLVSKASSKTPITSKSPFHSNGREGETFTAVSFSGS